MATRIPNLNSVDYSVWGCCNRWPIIAKFQLLTSGNDALNPAINQLSKRLMLVVKARVSRAHVEFLLNSTCALMIVAISLYDD